MIAESIENIIEVLTDNFIAIIMILSVLYMAINQIIVPEWLITAIGIVLAFYFKKTVE